MHAAAPTTRTAALSALLLMGCLGAVVPLAKALAPSIKAGVASVGAPKALVGVVIAAVVPSPEGLAALRAARANRSRRASTWRSGRRWPASASPYRRSRCRRSCPA